MAEPGPFSFDQTSAAFRRVEALSKELLEACYTAGQEQMANMLKHPMPGMPENSIEQRTAISLGLQAISNAAADAEYHGFNVVDGWAAGIASVLAQKPEPLRSSALRVIHDQINGYVARNLQAFDTSDVAGRG